MFILSELIRFCQVFLQMKKARYAQTIALRDAMLIVIDPNRQEISF